MACISCWSCSRSSQIWCRSLCPVVRRLLPAPKNHTRFWWCCGKIPKTTVSLMLPLRNPSPSFFSFAKCGHSASTEPTVEVIQAELCRFLPKRFADTNHGVAGTNSSTWPNSLAVPNNWSLMLRVKSSNKSSASTCQRLIGENQLPWNKNTTVIWNIVMASTYHQSTELGTAPVRWRSCHVNTRSKPSVWSMKFKAAHVVAKTWKASRLQA